MAKVKETKLDAFRPQEHNHNTHSQRGMGALEASMRKHGYVSPMTAAADGEILDGSARLETVANVFGDDVMVVEHDGKRPIVMVRTDIPNATTNEAREISIAANRIAEINLTWNAAELLADMQSGIDMAGLFDQSELDALLAGMVAKAPVVDPGADVSKADELQKVWQVALGDVWQCGHHRLACGDCTDKATVDKLMQGERADMVFNDPPYGMRLDADFSGMVNHLDMAKAVKSGSKYDNVIGDHDDYDASPIVKMFDYVKEQFWFGADYYSNTLGDTMHSGAWMVWDKRLDESADKMYGSCFELLWSKQKHKRDILRHKWAGIFGLEKEAERSRVHPNQKPVALYTDILGRYSNQGASVVDCYAGSGTTLIACEQLGRQARCIEISPAYCSVILQRFMDMTNTTPVRLASSGNVK